MSKMYCLLSTVLKAIIAMISAYFSNNFISLAISAGSENQVSDGWL